MSEQTLGPSGQATVMLDVGGEIGALVLNVPAELDGEELDITGCGPEPVHTHTMVRPRHLPDGVLYAAVYPGLPQGPYLIHAHPSHPEQRVEVIGGQITSVEWRPDVTTGTHREAAG